MRWISLALVLLAAGCAFRRGDPLPPDPPDDFVLEVVVEGADAWPFDGLLRFEAPGSVAYDVTHRGVGSDRRGREPLAPDALREAWSAAAASGLFTREPAPEAEARGPVVVTGRALGLDGRLEGDPAADAELAALLEGLRRAAPARVFRPIPPP